MTGLILARAGGGHSFGGFSTPSRGGGFGGGGGGVHLHGFGFPFFWGGGGFGGGSILVIVLIVGALVLVGMAAARRRSQPIEPPMDPEGIPGRPAWTPPPFPAPGGTQDAPADQGLAAIKAHDPAFEEASFLSGAERSFFLVQKAWSERQPDLSRQVMADAIWAQHKSQIEGYVDSHKRNVLEDLAVGSARIVAATSDQSLDTVTVRFNAACADYDVDDRSGKIVRGDRDVRQWSEDWLFQRSSSATTRSDGGTLAQKCPNCGAPLEADVSGTCPYCRQMVMGGQYDWVLSRIDQVPGYYGSAVG
ncbi:MAG TPA: transporter [Acidimicrobiales bacterium]|nr:transporter [Acidimicrobiales bacterium]